MLKHGRTMGFGNFGKWFLDVKLVFLFKRGKVKLPPFAG